MNIKHAYDTWSASYDSGRNLTRDLAGRIVRESIGQKRFHSIIETGCGTGWNTSFLAGIGDTVHAIDFSEGMLDRAKANVKKRNIVFSVADIAGRWPVNDNSADLVVCALVLEHIQDLAPVFAEAHRTLQEGGIFLICELHPTRQYLGARATFQNGREAIEISAFVHPIPEFIDTAARNGFSLLHLKEFWHEEDSGKPPRIISFLFQNREPSARSEEDLPR